jgi:hypothetical protein
MLITNKFAFSHIPKTGGHTAMTMLRIMHPDAKLYEAHAPLSSYGSLLALLPVFTLVRDPLSWWKSWYNFNKIDAASQADTAMTLLGKSHLHRSYDSFVKRVFAEVDTKADAQWTLAKIMHDLDIGPLTLHYLRCACANFGEIVEKGFDVRKQRCVVGKTESLEADLMDFLRVDDLPKIAPHNVGKYVYSYWLSPESESLIRHKERVIYEDFGYV